MANLARYALKIKDLRFNCDPESLGFETTDELKSRPNIIGQDRALDAIRLGLEIGSPGYNIYVAGLTGTGKSTAIQRLLESMDREKHDLRDLCYIYNFDLPDSPVCVALPAGRGKAFKTRMDGVFDNIHDYIPLAFKSEKFKKKYSEIIEDVKARRTSVMQKLEREVNERGFSLVEVEYGPFTRPEIAPVVAGEVVSMEALPGLLAKGKLGHGDFEKIQREYPELMSSLEEVVGVSRDLQRELTERLSTLEREHIRPIVEYALEEVRKQFPDDKIDAYLDGLFDYILDNLHIFRREEQSDEVEVYREEVIPFEVNLLVDNTKTKKAPVIIETAPTFVNLFGTIERTVDGEGEYMTDFTAIRAGSVLRANGGFLVLNLNDLLEEPHVWVTLKRTLKHKKLTIRGFDSLLLVPIAALKPEPIDLDVKVVLIGDAYSYQILYEFDEDFGKIFKVKAEFDRVMPNQKRNISRYCQFIRNLTAEESLRPFHKSGAAAIIEEGVRLAARKDRISTRFSDIGDVIREASYWAGKDRSKSVRRRHVAKAVGERERRVSLYEDKLQEMIDDGTILLDIDGAKIGQVNGLTVFDIGDYTFGRPARITVETGVGRSGLINVEREADMSGRTYNKGVLILDGYIRRMYAQDKPVTMNASICFEQSYSGIDGDSASSTEIYALLSSLAEVPLRQDIAVTGSVNQKGEIQPIGGVNEKIEGFHEVCKLKGFTGKQGVLIPARNKVDVVLRKEVVTDIVAGRFHVYAINTIDEGIEILTGLKAGKRRKDGRFERDSVHDKVDRRLREFHERLKESEDSKETGDSKASRPARRRREPPSEES
jgi:lon-related putative ATP-dependent protease